jgi:hypothetical protein
MNPHLDPSFVILALLIGPATRSIVFLAAAAISLWSRRPERRSEARRLLRLIAADPPGPPEG